MKQHSQRRQKRQRLRSSQQIPQPRRWRFTWLGLACLCAALWGSVARTQDAVSEAPAQENAEKVDPPKTEEPKAAKSEVKQPLARYLTVSNPVNEVMFTRVRNVLVALQHQAEQEDRAAVLVLELERGTSTFGQARDLAKELTSSKYSRVRTVAWIPQPSDGKKLDGYISIVALACQEIVMHPDAEIGDIGRGQTVETDEQQFVINLVEKRYNTKINGALATGFVDPSKAVLRIRVENKQGDKSVPETRLVTADELRRLQESNIPILQVETVKEQRDAAQLSGKHAKALDVLVTHLATERADLADIYGFDRQYLREEVVAGAIPKAKLIRVEGMIEPILHEFVDRELRRAVADKCDLIIFEIESPGGYLLDSEQLADKISLLDAKKVRTVAYVPDHAFSGAAIIAMGCDQVILHPNARIGDAGPIETHDGQAFERAPEKILSPLRTTLRQLAERKGRPSALLESMADKDLEVFQVTHRDTGRIWYMSDAEIQNANGEWHKGPLVPESRIGNLLTVDGKRAHEIKIADEPVADMSELKSRLGIPKEYVIPTALQTWVDTLVSVLKSGPMTFLLFVVGIMCIYLEAYTVTGFFGIGAALCFALYFWSQFMGGTAGWLEVVLFLFGLACLGLEIFIIPGFGVFGITGGLCVLFSIILASQTFVIPHTPAEFTQVTWTMGTLSSSIIAVGVLALVLGRFMPHLPGFRDLILSPPGPDGEGPRLDPILVGGNAPVAKGFEAPTIGTAGKAFSVLRPAGKAQIDGRVVDVVAESGFIEVGTEIEVVAVAGNRVVVRQTHA